MKTSQRLQLSAGSLFGLLIAGRPLLAVSLPTSYTTSGSWKGRT
jgi:hypothetical protein